MRGARAKLLRRVAKQLSPNWRFIYKKLKRYDRNLNHKQKGVIGATKIETTL